MPLHLETSGAAPLALSGRFDWITLSPKRHRPPSAELLAACSELKVVVTAEARGPASAARKPACWLALTLEHDSPPVR